ncbi:outer membrane protein assembly factor BamE [Phaeospirillum tilakii]|uniref:Outer membrane protein assembly factor BamE n=1 Tax=Phaeospirillum tilakii TaxID=741673 RepID=A0ABW5CDL8_9PROT
MPRRPPFLKKSPAALLVPLALAALAACTPDIELRGNLPPPEQLAQVTVGKSSRDDVQSLLGTPSNVSPFDDSAWFYISTVSEKVSFFPAEIKERKVIGILFDDAGIVRAVQTKTLADGHDVSTVSRETPTAGKEMTIVEQLFGNLGRFSKKEGEKK